MHIERKKLESPIEEIFIQQFEKFVEYDCEIIPQYVVSTSKGNFRMDFVIKSRNSIIGIELDGKEFHDIWRDEWRDAMILGNEKVDTIYRFTGKDITTYINECIYIIYKYDKKVFNERYAQVSSSLLDIERFEHKDSIFKHKEDHIIFSIETTDLYGEKTGLHHKISVIRRCKNTKNQYWHKLYKFYEDHKDLNFDELIQLRKKGNCDRR